MPKSWGGAGAWAADAEQAEADAKHRAAASLPFAAAAGGQEAFPTLGEAVSSKPQKKKKHQTLSLSEVLTGKYVGPGGGKTRQMSDSQKLTAQEMLLLPTAPRDRSEEDPQQGGLGGGFKDYGGYRDQERGKGGQERERDGDQGYGERRRGFGGGFDRENTWARDGGQDDGPSRADENDDWGSKKNFVPFQGAGGFDDRKGGRSSDRDLSSRADEVENWGSSKKFTSSNGSDRASSDRPSSGFGFGKGYEEAPSRRSSGYQEAPPRKGGYEETLARGSNSRAESEDWGSSKRVAPIATQENRGWDSGIDRDRWSRRDYTQNGSSNAAERPRLVLQPRSKSVSDDETLPPNVKNQNESSNATILLVPKEKSNPFGAARPREEVLAEKGLDHRKVGSDVLTMDKGSRPSSSHSSRPATPDSLLDLPVNPRPKVNPFGDAKPREVLLQKKGKDWRKIDFELEHRSVDRPLSEEEKMLKEELSLLLEQAKNEIHYNGESGTELGLDEQVNAAGEKESIQKEIYRKERELEQLTRALDDKVRFSQRGGERTFGRSEAGTGKVYEPPRSEGRGADVWTRQSNDWDRRSHDGFNDMPRQR